MHYSGAYNFIAALGGLTQMAVRFPYLRLAVFHASQLETTAIATSYRALENPNRIPRDSIDDCYSISKFGGKAFNPCPHPLFEVLGDIGDSISRSAMRDEVEPDTLTNIESILSTAMSFDPLVWAVKMGGTRAEQYT
jgi:hypothetical protein